jgi:hypothetical protein
VVKAKITRYCDGIDMVGYVQGMIIQMNGHKNGYDHVMYITVQFHDGNKFREVNQDDCEKVG